VHDLRAEPGDGEVMLTLRACQWRLRRYLVSDSPTGRSGLQDEAPQSTLTLALPFGGLQNGVEYEFQVAAESARGARLAATVKATPRAPGPAPGPAPVPA
jgi:hypothetical protein